MLEKNLTLRQNMCAARIFLNAFGFILDKFDEISELSKIKINKNLLKHVGDLYFENGFSIRYFMQMSPFN